MELVYVVVGGLLALLGGAVTALFSHRLGRRQSHRQDLVAAYIEWSARLSEAVEQWKQLQFYDHVARLAARHEELRDVPTSPAGCTREEIVRGKLLAMRDLEAACCRVLLVENDTRFAERAVQISDFASSREIPDRADQIMRYTDEKIAASHELMRALRSEHTLLRTP